MSQGVPITRQQAEVYGVIISMHAQAFLCGSYRRGKSEIGDLDVALIADPDEWHPLVERITGALQAHVIRGGDAMMVLNTPAGHQIDLYRTEVDYLGAMVLMLTGSARFNKRIRYFAKEMGCKLNQYGLWDRATDRHIAGSTEPGIFKVLGLDYVQPKDR